MEPQTVSEKDPPQKPTPEDVETAEPAASAPDSSELQALKLAEAEKKYLYLYAEFDTFKKRAFKERQEALKFGWEPVARNLLDVLDNLERAFDAASKSGTPGSIDLLKGLELVIRDFRSTLTRNGVEAIDVINKPFDPHTAEAVAQADSDLPVGTVCAEITKGYLFNGRLLRPARVNVSSGNKKQNSPLTEGDSSPS
jgi:molecular chaperone GrpE